MLPQKTRMISRIVELKLEEAEIYSKSLFDVEKIDINANHELVVELRTNVAFKGMLEEMAEERDYGYVQLIAKLEELRVK